MTPQFPELAVSVSIQATLVVAAAYWIGRLTENERIRCRLWTICYVLLLLLVVNAAVLPHPRPFQPIRPATRPVAAEMVSLQLHIGQVLFQIWLFGCGASSLLFIYRTIQAEKFLRRCRAVDPDVISLARIAGDESEEFDPTIDRRTVRLVSTTNITSPFCWQFHHPYIVIPESLLTYEQDELKYILKHELAHLQTGHPMQVFVQRMTEILYWFHPLVWWASRASALDREFLCDDEAAQTRGDIVSYLKTLLLIAEKSSLQDHSTSSLPFVRNRCELAERSRRLVRLAQRPVALNQDSNSNQFQLPAISCLVIVTVIGLASAWVPVNLMASPDSSWSPWPRWTAGVLNDFGIKARDFEVYNHRYAPHELFEDDDDHNVHPLSKHENGPD